MSPASYLTAPPRDATTMVAHHGSLDRARVLPRRARRGARVRRFPRSLALAAGQADRGAFSDETARIAEVSEQIQVHLDRASASSERLGAVAERLAVSRAKLEVQLQAIREARHAMRRLLWFLPGT